MTPSKLEHQERVLRHQRRMERLMQQGQRDLPCREEGGDVAMNGECLRCGADQGSACRQ